MRNATKNFISVRDFVEEFEVTRNLVYVSVHSGKIPAEHIKREKKYIRLNKNYFINRRALKRNLKSRCQDRYYQLSEYFDTDSQLIRELEKHIGKEFINWSAFVYSKLFTTFEHSVLSLKVSRIQKQFLYLSGRILREFE